MPVVPPVAHSTSASARIQTYPLTVPFLFDGIVILVAAWLYRSFGLRIIGFLFAVLLPSFSPGVFLTMHSYNFQ